MYMITIKTISVRPTRNNNLILRKTVLRRSSSNK